MVFQAGQKVRASEINRGVPTLVRVTADTSVVSSTALVNATGALLPVEASAHYWWRCLLFFDSGTTPDLKVAWTVPAGADGFWGSVDESVRVSDYGDAATLTLDGANSMAELSGWLQTSAAAGSLQLRFAQNASSGTTTSVKAGTVLSIARLP